MRNLIYLILCVLLCNVCTLDCKANDANHAKKIEQIKANHDYSALISAIIAVESEGNEKAVSANGQCCGVLQITPILVKEVNNILGYEKYTLQDRFNKEKSIEMFYIMQHRHNASHDMRKAISLWNRSTWYYNKVMKQYNKAKA